MASGPARVALIGWLLAGVSGTFSLLGLLQTAIVWVWLPQFVASGEIGTSFSDLALDYFPLVVLLATCFWLSVFIASVALLRGHGWALRTLVWLLAGVSTLLFFALLATVAGFWSEIVGGQIPPGVIAVSVGGAVGTALGLGWATALLSSVKMR